MKPVGYPRCERGAALAVLVVLIVVLAASAAIMWPKFNKYSEDFDTARQELAAARQEVRSLKQRPTVDELGVVRTSLASTKDELAKAVAALTEKTRACEAGAVEIARLEADLLTTVESYENARRAASGKEDMLGKLDATARKLTATERALAVERGVLAAKEDERLKLQADLDKATADIAERDGIVSGLRRALVAKEDERLKLQADLDGATADIAERDRIVSRLRRELAEIPLMPLPNELAKQKYYEYLNSVAEFTDRESRVSALFRAKIALAGSAYEAKADAQWRREIKMKHDDVDRAARLAYDNVSFKVRVHPDAHDENVRLLQEALEKVLGSRYEKVLQQLIDREHELKAAGR